MTDNFNKTLELLELSLTSKDDNNKQLEISQKLKELSKNKQEHITILIKALSINIYNTFNISLELHESISIYLKNFIQNQLTFMDENEISNSVISKDLYNIIPTENIDNHDTTSSDTIGIEVDIEESTSSSLTESPKTSIRLITFISLFVACLRQSSTQASDSPPT